MLASTIHEFTLAAGSQPDKVITGLDGSVYIFEHGSNKLARLRPHASAFQEIPVSAAFDPVHFGMVLSTKGDVYFSVHNGIGAYSPKFNTVKIVPLTYTPNDFAPGPDGNLWFTVPDNSTFGRMTLTSGSGQFVPNNNVATWQVPSFANQELSTGEAAITRGPKGDLWFTENGPGKVAQIIPGKTGAPVVHEYALPTAAAHPLGITSGPDGNIWIAETGANKIARVNESSKAITEFNIPRASSGSFWITVGPDKALWFTERNADRLGRITTGGSFSETGIVPSGALADVVSDIKGPGNTLWFTEKAHNKAGQLVF